VGTWTYSRGRCCRKEKITVTSSSNISVDFDHPQPVPLTVDGIKYVIQDYVQAATNAMAAGFDGVELHGANGYLYTTFSKTHATSAPTSMEAA
jgi:2,4-dienoyl-CoA reductase-like NADH-dependent reductase (Old Yellow Enzyme family)